LGIFPTKFDVFYRFYSIWWPDRSQRMISSAKFKVQEKFDRINWRSLDYAFFCYVV